MKIWLVYDKFEAERNKRCISFYFEHAKKLGIRLELKLIEDIEPGPLPDVAIVRTPAPEFSAALSEKGVKVYNSAALSAIANDKMNTYLYFLEKGIRMPETYLVNDAFRPPFYPIVLKPAGGHGGRGVKMINSENEYFDYIKGASEKCIAQRPVTDLGKDLRVYVIGGRIFAAMLRTSKTDFRSNFCLGGKAEVYSLSKEERSEAEKIISFLDKGYFGVDFMFDNGRIIFNELEDVVGARMLYTHTSLDPVGAFVDFIVSH